MTEVEEKSSEEELKTTVGASQKLKRAVVLSILASVVLFLIIDFATSPCEENEKELNRRKRLFCEDIPFNGTFSCDSPGSDFKLKASDPPVCVQASSCTNEFLRRVSNWLEDNTAAGIVLAVVVYALATVFLVPGSVLTLGTAAAFSSAFGLGVGIVLAGFCVWLGASIGLTFAFINGRYLLRDFAESLVKKYEAARAVDEAISESAFKVVLLLRLSPVVPYNVMNYVMGATKCGFKDYIIASVVGIIPGTFAFVFIGATLSEAAGFGQDDDQTGELSKDDCSEKSVDTVRLILIIAGSIATFVAVFILSYYSRQEWLRIKAETASSTKSV